MALPGRQSEGYLAEGNGVVSLWSLESLNNLEKAGLLKAQTGGRNNYPTIRKTLRLWMDDVNEQVRCVPASHPASSLRQQTHLNLSICPTSYGPFHIILVCACVVARSK